MRDREMGPTAYAAAKAYAEELKEQIHRLRLELRAVTQRLHRYKGSSILESERLATAAEPFQQKQL